jgi:hypothetical protein
MGLNIRTKGKNGEYEFIDKFGPLWTAHTAKPIERNLDQTRYGGSDMTNVEPFCIEIKRVEDCSNGNKNSWWKQVVKATKEGEYPIVAFRPSRSKWRFLISTAMFGILDGRYAEIEEDTFVALVLKEMQADMS